MTALTGRALRLTRGIEGFGASSRIHTSRLLSLSEDLPVAIVDECEVVRYVGRAPGPDTSPDRTNPKGKNSL
jgi:hypothetical protein